MRRKRAFSLIELMVVIVIIGVLAAVAVPSYGEYIARTKVAAFWSILDSVRTRAMEYHANQGTWPNASQLGYLSADDVNLDDPTTLSEYFTVFSVNPANTGACSADIVAITWTADHAALGISDATTYNGYLYLGEMPNGFIGTMCRESIDGSTFGHNYMGDVCAYSDISSFDIAICS